VIGVMLSVTLMGLSVYLGASGRAYSFNFFWSIICFLVIE